MTPRALFSLDVPEGTRLVICALYNDDDVDGDAVRAWEEGRSDVPPFVWQTAGYKPLQEITGRSRSRVADDLSKLSELGVLRRATRDGRRGWELLGVRGLGIPGPSGGTRGSQSADAKVPAAGRPGPTSRTPARAPAVPRSGPSSPSAGTPGSHQRDPARTHAPARAVLIHDQAQRRDEQRLPAGRGGAANDSPSSEAPRGAAASENPTDRRLASPALQGPARTTLLELVREFGDRFVPRTEDGAELESRRVKPDVDTLRRLAELLTPPADVDVDAWLEREIQQLRGYVRDYASICEVDPEQARSWGGWMFENRLIKSATASAWTTLTRIVDRWREAQAVARREEREREARAAAAERRAVDDRLAELEQRARRGETPLERELLDGLGVPARDHAADHAAAEAAVRAARAEGRTPTLADVDAAVRATPPLSRGVHVPGAGVAHRDLKPENVRSAAGPVSAASLLPSVTPLPELPPTRSVAAPPERELSEEDEEALRRRGRDREAHAARSLEQQHHQLTAAFNTFCATMGRAPTPAEANEIRRCCGAEEATGT